MRLLPILLILFSFISCEEENNTPTKPIDDDFMPMPDAEVKQGSLMGVGHSVSGTVMVYDENGTKTLVLDPFTSQNGPDLKVYLSNDTKATQHISLGALKSTTGKQSYPISGMPDFTQYKYVLIWCEQYSVLFGKAELAN